MAAACLVSDLFERRRVPMGRRGRFHGAVGGKSRGPSWATGVASQGFRESEPQRVGPRVDGSWNEELVSALSNADRAIGRLAGEARRFPHPGDLHCPLPAAGSGAVKPHRGHPDDTGRTVRGAGGCVRGAGLRGSRRGREPCGCAGVRAGATGHPAAVLAPDTQGPRAAHAWRSRRYVDAGRIRRSSNWIGPPGCTLNDASYVPPPVDEMAGCLDALERFLHDRTLPPLVHAGLTLAQFEAIHPFLDGNGRVGRLLMTLLLIEREVLPLPLLYLSAWFEASREDYYAHLLAVTREGAWERWLVYFLRGVQVQAEDAIRRMEEMDGLFEEWRETLASIQSGRPDEVLRLFVGNPFWTVGRIAKALGVAYTTARRAIDRLEATGIRLAKAERRSATGFITRRKCSRYLTPLARQAGLSPEGMRLREVDELDMPVRRSRACSSPHFPETDPELSFSAGPVPLSFDRTQATPVAGGHRFPPTTEHPRRRCRSAPRDCRVSLSVRAAEESAATAFEGEIVNRRLRQDPGERHKANGGNAGRHGRVQLGRRPPGHGANGTRHAADRQSANHRHRRLHGRVEVGAIATGKRPETAVSEDAAHSAEHRPCRAAARPALRGSGSPCLTPRTTWAPRRPAGNRSPA